MYEAAFIHAGSSPLYNGDTCIVVFARDESGVLGEACGVRNLPDTVTSPSDPHVTEALREMGYRPSNGACGPCVIKDEAGWRMLVMPAI